MQSSTKRSFRQSFFAKCVLLGLFTGAMLPAATLFAAPAKANKSDAKWEKMDYGPFLSATLSAPLPKDNWAMKGIAIHLGDADHPAAILFDTTTLRYAAGWT